MTICPHGDPTCPCPDLVNDRYDPCHYEGADAMICPNPVLGIEGLSNPHCHVEGCSWHVYGCSPDRPVEGECGLLKLSVIEPVSEVDGQPYYSMTQAKPESIAWACGWLRTPLNVSSGREVPK